MTNITANDNNYYYNNITLLNAKSATVSDPLSLFCCLPIKFICNVAYYSLNF